MPHFAFLGWVAAGVLVGIVIALLVTIQGRDLDEIKAVYEGYSAECDRLPSTPVVLEGSKVDEHSAADNQSDCDQRANADLRAQRSMAQSAVRQASYNLFGLLLLLLSLVFTGWAAVAASTAAIAAQESAREAANANELARTQYARQFDPHLFIESVECGDQSKGSNHLGLRYWITLVVRNEGHWPAFMRRQHIYIFDVSDGIVHTASGPGDRGLTQRLMPNEQIVLEFGSDGPINGDLYFGVRLTYDTMNELQRFRDFWMWLRTPPTSDDPWVDRIDEPKWIRTLPSFIETPWTKSNSDDSRRDS